LRINIVLFSIISSQIDRLARFAATEEGGIPSDIQLFDIFSKQTQLVYEARPEMPIQDVIALQVSLLNVTISCYPGNLANVDQVLKTASDKLATSSESKGLVFFLFLFFIFGLQSIMMMMMMMNDDDDVRLDKQNTAGGKQLIKLLSIPVDNFNCAQAGELPSPAVAPLVLCP